MWPAWGALCCNAARAYGPLGRLASPAHFAPAEQCRTEWTAGHDRARRPAPARHAHGTRAAARGRGARHARRRARRGRNEEEAKAAARLALDLLGVDGDDALGRAGSC
eukprot:scaffold45831_cov46-Phaeocystis_antarctica.AAC.1